jgi:hypothetical protein
VGLSPPRTPTLVSCQELSAGGPLVHLLSLSRPTPRPLSHRWHVELPPLADAHADEAEVPRWGELAGRLLAEDELDRVVGVARRQLHAVEHGAWVHGATAWIHRGTAWVPGWFEPSTLPSVARRPA